MTADLLIPWTVTTLCPNRLGCRNSDLVGIASAGNIDSAVNVSTARPDEWAVAYMKRVAEYYTHMAILDAHIHG